MAGPYYVDPVNGSDSNNGLGPDASDATNKPFATIGKLIASGGSLASGETAYLAPGYFREVVTVGITSYVAETKIIGDPMNAQGFKTSGGVLVAPGPVVWTAYTTNDKTAPSSSNLLNLNGRDFITFQKMNFVQGNAVCILATTTSSTDITFKDCAFLAAYHGVGGNMISVTAAAQAILNWTIDRCIFLKGSSTTILITLTTGTGAADYDTNFVIKNTAFLGGNSTSVQVSTAGTSANEGGGVDLLNCTQIGGANVIFTNGTRISLTYPCTVANCFVLSGQTALNAGESGAITDAGYNLFVAGATPRTNVTAGSGSVSDGSYAPMVDFGQALLHGFRTQMFGVPMPSSPLLGFGASTAAPTYDLLNLGRPGGGNSASTAAGALERYNPATKSSSSGSSVMTLLGPGTHDLFAGLNSGAASVVAYGLYDSGYANSGSLPYLQVTGGSHIGIADASAIMTGASGTWEKLTVTVTAASAGFVTARFVSRSASDGYAYFRSASILQ